MLCYFETMFHYVAWPGLKHAFLLPQPLECQDYTGVYHDTRLNGLFSDGFSVVHLVL